MGASTDRIHVKLDYKFLVTFATKLVFLISDNWSQSYGRVSSG